MSQSEEFGKVSSDCQFIVLEGLVDLNRYTYSSIETKLLQNPCLNVSKS